jgi:hypothetical protein
MGEDQIFLATINLSRSRIFLSSEVIYEYHATNINSLTNNNEAVSELEHALYFLGKAVHLGKTNKLGVYLLAKMLITFFISVRRKKIVISYNRGLILVKHSFCAILKNASRKNSNRLTLVE